MKQLVVLTIHGMGETQTTYADHLREQLKQHLGQAQFQKLHFGTIYYQKLIQENQRRVWADMPESLRWRAVRRFALFYLSDAVTIYHQVTEVDSIYIQIQLAIRQAAEKALSVVGNPSTPVVIIAQSLGCQIISNYLWDASRNRGIWQGEPPGRPEDEVSFLKLRTTQYLLSSGCNIPLFVAGLKKIVPIDKPTPSFRWINYYDVDDVLGWPLGPLSGEYKALVEDVEINVGHLLAHWNPASHAYYWSSPEFTRRAAAFIQRLLT